MSCGGLAGLHSTRNTPKSLQFPGMLRADLRAWIALKRTENLRASRHSVIWVVISSGIILKSHHGPIVT